MKTDTSSSIFLGIVTVLLLASTAGLQAQSRADVAVYTVDGPIKARMLKSFTGSNLQASLAPINEFAQTVYEEPLNRFAENALEICSEVANCTYEDFAQRIARKYDISRSALDDVELNDAFRATMALVFRLGNRPIDFYATVSVGADPRVLLLLAVEEPGGGVPRILKAWAGDDLVAYLGGDALQTIEAAAAAGGSDDVKRRDIQVLVDK